MLILPSYLRMGESDESTNKYGMSKLPEELFSRILSHLNVSSLKRLMKQHSIIFNRLINNYSLWCTVSGTNFSSIEKCLEEIKNKITLRRNIANKKTEKIIDRKTMQSDMTYMKMRENRIVCSSDDQTVKMFNFKGELVKSFIGHKGGVWTLEFNDKYLVTGSTDKTARVWDIITGHTLVVLMGHKSTVRTLKIKDNFIITGSRDSEIRIWNFDGTCLHILKGHYESVRCLDIDSKYLVSGSYDGSVALWNYKKGILIRHLKKHDNRVYGVCISSRYIASTGLDSYVHVSDINGKHILSYKIHRSLVAWIKFVKSNRYILTSGADCILCKWDVHENCLVFKIEERFPIISQCVISDLLIIGTQKDVKIYNLNDGTFIRTLFSSGFITKVEVYNRCIAVGYIVGDTCRLIIFNF